MFYSGKFPSNLLPYFGRTRAFDKDQPLLKCIQLNFCPTIAAKEWKTENGKRKKMIQQIIWLQDLKKWEKPNHLVANSKSLEKQTCAIGSKINGLCTGWCINA